MPSPISWPVILAVRGRGFGAETEPTPAADAAAWSLIALLVFCVAGIVTTALLIRRRLRNQNPPGELRRDVKAQSETMQHRPAWEKPGDWWKG